MFETIPKDCKAKTAIVYFDDEVFAKVDLNRIKLPCKNYNIVFLAIESYINADFEWNDRQLLEMINEPFWNLMKLMTTQLGIEKAEELIKETPILQPFSVKLDYGIVV